MFFLVKKNNSIQYHLIIKRACQEIPASPFRFKSNERFLFSYFLIYQYNGALHYYRSGLATVDCQYNKVNASCQ